MANVRRTGGQQQGHGCPFCGSGGRKGGGLWKWLGWGALIYVVVMGLPSTTDSGDTDYKPPAQTQTQEKCDPDALIQFGCTP